MPQTDIDPRHSGTQSALRIVGPLLIVLGAILMITGAIGMFSPARNIHNPTEGFMEGRKSFDQVSHDMHDEFSNNARSSFAGFGMVAAGMVSLVLGIAATKFGYMGSVARYVSQEVTPVVEDTFNHVADRTQGGIRNVAESISEGIAQGMTHMGTAAGPATSTGTICPKCSTRNETGAKFCDQCGAAMSKQCPTCQHLNAPDARFCDKCGQALA